MDKILITIGVGLVVEMIGLIALGKYLVSKLATKDEVKILVQEAEKELLKELHKQDKRISILEKIA